MYQHIFMDIYFILCVLINHCLICGHWKLLLTGSWIILSCYYHFLKSLPFLGHHKIVKTHLVLFLKSATHVMFKKFGGKSFIVTRVLSGKNCKCITCFRHSRNLLVFLIHKCLLSTVI